VGISYPLTIGHVLGRDGVQQFTSDRDAQISQVTEQLPGCTEALVDFECPIDIWIVDEPFPAHRSSRFLISNKITQKERQPWKESDLAINIISQTYFKLRERESLQIRPHDDAQIGPIGDLCLEQVGVDHGLLGAVDGARADDDKDAVVLACQNARGVETGGGYRALGAYGRDDLVSEQGRLDEGVVLGG
jgi:hypothetical protein